MQKRKLQIFLSSTYGDLVYERLAAMEAILSAGHIPAAMEQFAPGDETAAEKINAWIDESDAFILILGGRYGSIEPNSGKSYVQMEYEYALEKKKPLFAMVISKEHHEERVKNIGLTVDERENQQEYRKFRDRVTTRLCAFWSDKKDIRATIFQKLPEWAQRSDLIGWVRADQSATPEVVNELARLSHENRELRSAITSAETFAALTFEELAKVMQESPASPEDLDLIRKNLNLEIQDSATLLDVFHTIFNPMSYISSYPSTFLHAFVPLKGLGLVQNIVGLQTSLELTDTGRRFRNRLLVEARRTHWEK